MYLARRLLPVLGLVLIAATGCTDDGGPVFDDQGGQQISCMRHQAEPPGSRYTDPERRNTGELLAMLRYYTAHGTQPYCDGAAPTEVDRAWAELYVQLGADRSKVAPLLDGQ
ncbi:MAG: hypothetical protein ACRDT0_03975 [Pseudonocardiaceae bacterium]